MSERTDPRGSQEPPGGIPAGYGEKPAGAGDPETATPLERLGLSVCRECGREIEPEEKRHVRVARTAWAGEDGQVRAGLTRREARCTGCGPHPDIPGEETKLVAP